MLGRLDTPEIPAKLAADDLFPERALLLRELVRGKRAKEVAALCADTLHPPIVRPAFLVVRAQCLKVAPKR